MKALILLALLLQACTMPDAKPGAAPATGLANPASVFCVEQGGHLEIRKTPTGQEGWCHLPDGRVIEEWALFRQQNG